MQITLVQGKGGTLTGSPFMVNKTLPGIGQEKTPVCQLTALATLPAVSLSHVELPLYIRFSEVIQVQPAQLSFNTAYSHHLPSTVSALEAARALCARSCFCLLKKKSLTPLG